MELSFTSGASAGVSPSTDSAIVRFDGIVGALQNSGVTIDDSNNMLIPTSSSLKIGATFEFNTLDGLSRTQIWNRGPSPILRIGSSTAEGDSTEVAAEGIVVYGPELAGAQTNFDIGFARVKHNRFGLYSQTNAGAADYYFRVDNTRLFLATDAMVKTFQVTRATGDTYTTGKLGVGATAPTSSLEVAGSLATKTTASATGATLDATHCVRILTATGQTDTLPTAVGIQGRRYTIKLSASGSATVATTSSQTIDGSTTYSLSAQYKYVTVISDNANWHIIANN